ncbi:hypothetical protein BC937DRAFT_87612 [Endogone sp. FLAS-F59071]|nr:hypothetical protein BC937DRAFT_87612 [Endogone sp. FLAS-F59071]|eukprot:RUS19361.1 hypothetical protein BC937DRAFT_87612 [Endogone sp. FLAS-F59071]
MLISLPFVFAHRHLIHGNFNSPVEDDLTCGIKVLDAGCGHGLWTIDMACDYSNSHFTGHDIDEVFPGPEAELPTNCMFLKADTLNLPFEDGTFDFVFQSMFNMLTFSIRI